MRRRSTILIGAFSLLVLYLLLAFLIPVASGPIFWIIGDKLDWESKRGVSLLRQNVSISRCQEPIAFHKELDWGKDRGMISCR